MPPRRCTCPRCSPSSMMDPYPNAAVTLPSVSRQEVESLEGVAELPPLSPGGAVLSYRGTGADSSHLHLGAVEMLSLGRSDPLPHKLLAHLAEAGGGDLRSLSPCMLRLSGAGFAYYAPGPETSV